MMPAFSARLRSGETAPGSTPTLPLRRVSLEDLRFKGDAAFGDFDLRAPPNGALSRSHWTRLDTPAVCQSRRGVVMPFFGK